MGGHMTTEGRPVTERPMTERSEGTIGLTILVRPAA
jgi:hypothetical protein